MKCCREERTAREARENEEKEFQLLMEMEEQKRKQQEYAADAVRKVKVSIIVSQHIFLFFSQKTECNEKDF